MRIEKDAKNQECEELRMQVDLYFYKLCLFFRVVSKYPGFSHGYILIIHRVSIILHGVVFSLLSF